MSVSKKKAMTHDNLTVYVKMQEKGEENQTQRKQNKKIMKMITDEWE